MKAIPEDSLQFVARHWQRGLFSRKQAWRRFRNADGQPGIGIYGAGHPFRRVPVWGYALGAALAAVVLGLFLFGSNARTVIPATAAVQSVILPDGTHAILAPGATLSFRRHGFGSRDRSLRQTGQIYYAVVRNDQLPFEITASEGFIRVLGTRFQVVSDSAGTAVDVVDGRVSFSASPGKDGLMLTKGMHAKLPAGASTPVLDEPATPNPAAWASHTFIYDNTPLDEVLHELSTQFGCTLTTDASDRRLTGEFENGDLAEIISLIETALGIQIKKAP